MDIWVQISPLCGYCLLIYMLAPRPLSHVTVASPEEAIVPTRRYWVTRSSSCLLGKKAGLEDNEEGDICCSPEWPNHSSGRLEDLRSAAWRKRECQWRGAKMLLQAWAPPNLLTVTGVIYVGCTKGKATPADALFLFFLPNRKHRLFRIKKIMIVKQLNLKDCIVWLLADVTQWCDCILTK